MSIVVVGISNADMIIKVPHLPKAGETILGGQFTKAAGGKGANQAVAAARAGGEVNFIAKVGNDIFGEMKKIAILAILLPCMVFSYGMAPPTKQPNVILIMTDDQGYGELSIHGNPILKTPNLDKLAKQSLRFTDFHVAPMCAPTRGQLLTGLDAARNGTINVSSGRMQINNDPLSSIFLEDKSIEAVKHKLYELYPDLKRVDAKND